LLLTHRNGTGAIFQREPHSCTATQNQRLGCGKKSNVGLQGYIFEGVREPASAALSTRQLLFRGHIRYHWDVAELVAAFKAHVERYHSQGEDFSQAAARIVREATKD
jgi:hypothetical protein